jgi:hypothetical protein
MPLPEFSVEEILETLKRSSLPTILCEGRDDMSVLRYLEAKLDHASLLACGGRDKLLAVFSRRAEITDLPIAFLADQDTWIFTRIPDEYQCIVFTWGYSIENDLIAGSGLERLLSREEGVRFAAALKEIIRWFAFEIDKLPASLPCVDVNLSRVLASETDVLSADFLAEIGFREASSEAIAKIGAEYQQFLRGKTWAQLLIRYLCHKSRRSKYQYDNLWEICVKLTDNDRINKIVDELINKLAEPKR